MKGALDGKAFDIRQQFRSAVIGAQEVVGHGQVAGGVTGQKAETRIGPEIFNPVGDGVTLLYGR